MRIVVFGDERRVGAWEGDRIVDLSRADSSLPSGLEAFIAAGPKALDAARTAIERATGDGKTGVVHSRDEVHLHAPAVRRPRIACAAGNYAEHTLGSAARKGSSSALADLAPAGTTLTAAEVVEKTRERDRPRGFWKDFAVPVGPEDAITYPERANQLDYEGEVGCIDQLHTNRYIAGRSRFSRSDADSERVRQCAIQRDEHGICIRWRGFQRGQ